MTTTRPRETVRWGDRLTFSVPVGGRVVSPDVFRVYGPFPQVWKVLAQVEVSNAANFANTFNLQLTIGIGSTVIQQVFPVIPNAGTVQLVEVPGENIAATLQTGASLAGVPDTWFFQAMVAPLVPWKGIEVEYAEHADKGAKVFRQALQERRFR